MKCVNCGKKFDYEKYYGICPKCGCFNKTETDQEQHQRYHDAYDGGYRHSEHTDTGYEETERSYETQGTQSYADSPNPHNTVYAYPAAEKEKSGKGSTIFLIASIVIFILVFFGGTAFGIIYKDEQAEKLQRDVIESQAERQEHAMGEEFAFQGMKLTVKRAWTVDKGQENNPNIPQGMKLVAVELRGESDGEWEDKNRLSAAYISYRDSYYEQIPSYEMGGNGEYGFYNIPLFESYSLCVYKEAEGCLMFWLDEDEQDFTLCLEERVDKDLIYIETIHSIDIHLEETDLGGQADE